MEFKLKPNSFFNPYPSVRCLLCDKRNVNLSTAQCTGMKAYQRTHQKNTNVLSRFIARLIFVNKCSHLNV